MNGIKRSFFIGLGGGFGVIISHIILSFTNQFTIYNLPILTILFYGASCFLLSFAITYFDNNKVNISEDIKIGVTQGLFASLASFALFNYNLITYLEMKKYYQAIFFAVLNTNVCLVFSYVGFKLGKDKKCRKPL